MFVIKFFLFILEAAHLYSFARCLYACTGEYRVSRKFVVASISALWLFENFQLAIVPLDMRSLDTLLLGFITVEIPALFLISFCYRGKFAMRLLLSFLLPLTYWSGKHVAMTVLGEIIKNTALPDYDGLRYLAATVVMVLLAFLLMLIFSKSWKSRQELERELLEQEVAMYENQFRIMQQSQNRIRSLKHDMKHHIKMLSDMIRVGEDEEALHYLSSMGAFMENSGEYVVSGNERIDGILNYMIARAKESGIDVRWKVQIPECLNISSFDINVILSNLFDNAQNALVAVREPFLDFTIKYDRNVLCISFRNNYDPSGLPVSTALEPSEHGYGLKNVSRIADRYNGELTVNKEGNIFEANVLLFL